MLKHHMQYFGILLAFSFFTACSQKEEDTKVNATGPTNSATSSQAGLANMPIDDGEPAEILTFSNEAGWKEYLKENGLEEVYPPKSAQQEIVEPVIQQNEETEYLLDNQYPIFDAIAYYLIDEPAVTFINPFVCVKPCTSPDVHCLCEQEIPSFDYLYPKLHKKPVGNIQKVKDLLEQGSDVNATDAFGRTPLMLAAMGNSQELINLLLEYGADINAKDFSAGKTALQFAKDFKQKQTIETLQQHGAK